MRNLAPIAIFAYNRPDHLRLTLDSLKNNELIGQSHLYAFSDGPKPNASVEENARITAVRETLHSIDFTRKLTVIEAEQNKGLARSVIDGVAKVVSEHGKIIVVEDDLFLSPYFLEYMNDALDKYQDAENVFQISGYMFPVKFKEITEDCLFLPYTTTWGWATWKRAWEAMDTSMSGFKLLSVDKKLRHLFDMNSTYPYYDMIKNQLNGKVSSWGIQWYLSVFVKNGLTLHPRKTLVIQNGFDDQATHTVSSSYENASFYANELISEKVRRFPDKIEVLQSRFNDYIAFFKTYNKQLKKQKIKQKINPIIIITALKRMLKLR
jgi:hypothetical protein